MRCLANELPITPRRHLRRGASKQKAPGQMLTFSAVEVWQGLYFSLRLGNQYPAMILDYQSSAYISSTLAGFQSPISRLIVKETSSN
ncbi:hypothetical protein NPIL_245661 [Nephila pilipes]|uniref:Uncharacterized protein n=1 Tax=Nephila pilipes TaxID=299642 RepID=A0A8X6NV81_NEPPI|nr:hypothetical protein NPIL_245661 [Nephila pilipes]